MRGAALKAALQSQTIPGLMCLWCLHSEDVTFCGSPSSLVAKEELRGWGLGRSGLSCRIPAATGPLLVLFPLLLWGKWPLGSLLPQPLLPES